MGTEINSKMSKTFQVFDTFWVILNIFNHFSEADRQNVLNVAENPRSTNLKSKLTDFSVLLKF